MRRAEEPTSRLPSTGGSRRASVAQAELAERVFASLDGAEFPGQVARRYQPGPSPLVRDAVRGYRTGRLERVLAGDFDLFEP